MTTTTPLPANWDTTRPYLTRASLLDAPPTPSAPPLSTYPSSVQHALALDDILHALLGMRTTYTSITLSPHPVFSLHSAALRHASPDIHPLLSRLLPLASHHATVAAFVEEARLPSATGYVNQAISVALSDLLHDYRQFILRLEHSQLRNSLSLQKLLYYVQPSTRAMHLLYRVVDAVRHKTGGAALNALYNLAVAHVGSPHLADILALLVGKAAEPIFATMDMWIRTGVIHDPYHEFFIQENPAYAAVAVRPSVTTSTSAWEMRYTVNRDHVPDFLAPFVENILRAGKYLNVLRECGLDAAKAAKSTARLGERQELRTESDGRYAHLQLDGKALLGPQASRRIANVVENSFAVSSRALMTYLDDEIKIIRRLRSLRRYFLLEKSDFLVYFFDSAATELVKRRKDVSKSRLTSLLELSIRTSVSSYDEFHDDILCTLCPENFAAQIMSISSDPDGERDLAAMRSNPSSISGYESFALDYRLRWPVSLIVSNIEILKYQFIFRYLFYCKYVERELEECWRQHSQAKGPLRKVPSSFVRSFVLRNRMLQFVRNILYFTTADVIEPNWRILEASIQKAVTIDDLMVCHSRFLDTSVEQSLLSNEKHLKVFKNIAETCISFSAYTEKFAHLFSSKLASESVEDKLEELKYPRTLAKFETAFDMHLGRLLDGLSAVSKKRANVHLSNLCERLDSDGYYSRSSQRSLASYGV